MRPILHTSEFLICKTAERCLVLLQLFMTDFHLKACSPSLTLGQFLIFSGHLFLPDRLAHCNNNMLSKVIQKWNLGTVVRARIFTKAWCFIQLAMVNCSTCNLYMGCSINKLRHSVSFLDEKNPKCMFCREFNLGYRLRVLLRLSHCDIIYQHKIWWRCHWNWPVTSGAPLFVFQGPKHLIQIRFTPICVQYIYNKCFTKPRIHV